MNNWADATKETDEKNLEKAILTNTKMNGLSFCVSVRKRQGALTYTLYLHCENLSQSPIVRSMKGCKRLVWGKIAFSMAFSPLFSIPVQNILYSQMVSRG